MNFFKIHSNLLKAFQVDLKACLGLVLPASSLSEKIEAGFGVMFFMGHTHSLVVSTIQYDGGFRRLQIPAVVAPLAHAHCPRSTSGISYSTLYRDAAIMPA